MAPRLIKLGSAGLEVSELGYGCMGLTTAYGKPLSEPQIIEMLKKVHARGVTFWDTAFVYSYPNFARLLTLSSPIVCQEEHIAKAIKQVGRENVVIATKTGLKITFGLRGVGVRPCGDPNFIRRQCNESLRRLDVDCIDLYYLHRIDPDIPIEITMATMRDLVNEGKIKYVGLSKCSPSTLRRAHKVHPVTCIQMEYSLWARNIEHRLLPTCAELGVGVVAHSPLRRGFFGGAVKKKEDIQLASNYRNSQSRLQSDELERNAKLLEEVEKIAERKNATSAQLALAWLRHQQHRVNGAGIVPIPGTTKEKNLVSNVESLNVQLSSEDIAALEAAVRATEVAGGRYDDTIHQMSWENEKNKELPPEEAQKYYA